MSDVATVSGNSAPSVLEQLECPGCMGLMISPILQCNNGHEFCPKCYVKHSTCPICRPKNLKSVKITRSARKIEDIAWYTLITYNSQNKMSFNAADAYIRRKKMSHVHPTYLCPLTPCRTVLCRWSGKLDEVKLHYQKYHCDISNGAISMNVFEIVPSNSAMYVAVVTNTANTCLFQVCVCITRKNDYPVLCGAFYYGSELDGSSHIITLTFGQGRKQYKISLRPRPAIQGNFLNETVNQLSYFCTAREMIRLANCYLGLKLGVEVRYEALNINNE